MMQPVLLNHLVVCVSVFSNRFYQVLENLGLCQSFVFFFLLWFITLMQLQTPPLQCTHTRSLVAYVLINMTFLVVEAENIDMYLCYQLLEVKEETESILGDASSFLSWQTKQLHHFLYQSLCALSLLSPLFHHSVLKYMVEEAIHIRSQHKSILIGNIK